MQHCNCVVELSNLDLEREKEGGEARAEQHVTKGLRGQAMRGPAQRSADLHPQTCWPCWLSPPGFSGRPGCAFHCQPMGTLCVSSSPSLFLHVLVESQGWSTASCGTVPLTVPLQGFEGRAAGSISHHGPTTSSSEHKATLS